MSEKTPPTAPTTTASAAGQSPAPTKMVAAPKAKVKIKLLTSCFLRTEELPEGQVYGPGTEHEVDERQAAEFCDRRFEGYYAFSGERVGVGSKDRHQFVRAQRVAA